MSSNKKLELIIPSDEEFAKMSSDEKEKLTIDNLSFLLEELKKCT